MRPWCGDLGGAARYYDVGGSTMYPLVSALRILRALVPSHVAQAATTTNPPLEAGVVYYRKRQAGIPVVF